MPQKGGRTGDHRGDRWTGETGAGRFYMISVVSKAYGSTADAPALQREGLLKPSERRATPGSTPRRTCGSSSDPHLTRDLGSTSRASNRLNMRRKMEQMQQEVSDFVAWVRQELARAAQEGWQERLQQASCGCRPRRSRGPPRGGARSSPPPAGPAE